MIAMPELNAVEHICVMLVAWPVLGIALWPITLGVRKCFGVETIWAHKLNIKTCAIYGPMMAYLLLTVFYSPEFMNAMIPNDENSESN